MKKNTLTTFVLCLLSICCFGQEQYFEKTNAWVNIQAGHEVVIMNETTFMVYGVSYSYTGDGLFHGFICQSDLQGQLSHYQDYTYIDPMGLDVDWRLAEACKLNSNTYAAVGRYEVAPWETNYYFAAYLMLVDEECDSTAFYTLLPDGYQYSDAWCMAKTLDNQLIVGGLAKMDGKTYPYLVKVDTNGNKTFEQVYTQYNTEYNNIKSCSSYK